MSALSSLQITSSGSAQKNLLLKDLRSLKVPLPTLAEQDRTVMTLTSVDQKIDFEKKCRKNLSSLKKGLMQDIFSRKVEVR